MSKDDFIKMEDPSTEWRRDAACTGIPTSDFFPERINASNAKDVERIFRVCKSCKVSAECLREAMINDHDGIWAYTTFKQRMKFKKFLTANNVEDITVEHCKSFLSVNKNGKSISINGVL